MSLRSISEDEKPNPEIGKFGNVKVAVGYSVGMRGYYVKLSDIGHSNNSVFVMNRSDAGYLGFIGAMEFLSNLHRSLDSKGLYIDGNEDELAKIVCDLTVQLIERKRNEEK